MKEITGFFAFSIFEYNDFQKFKETIICLFEKEIKNGKIVEVYEPLDIENWEFEDIQREMLKFICWENNLYPGKIFFLSNKSDGCSSLCFRINRRLDCGCLSITFSKNPESIFRLNYYYPLWDLRCVYALREDRWVFYEEGRPLPFENIEYYKDKSIKKRINNEILKEYLERYGIKLSRIDENVSNSFSFKRLSY